MRRSILTLAAAAMMAASAPSAVRAEGLKEVADCLAFTLRWCKAAREDTNIFEETAVDFLCGVKLAACGGEIVGGNGDGAAR